jgi:hypothetical protein
MDACDRRMTTSRAVACGLAVLLAKADIPQVHAGTIPGHTATLAISLEGGALIAVANALSFSVQDIEAESGNDAPIAIAIPSPAELRDAGAEEGTFILIRNIPEGVSVSAGMATGRIWIVPLREARTLRLVTKLGMNARFQIGFHLIGPGNRVLAKTTATVNLRPRGAAAAIDPAAPKPQALKPPVLPQPQTESLTPRAEAVMLARGKDLLQQGGIAAARIIFEDLATHGSAAGALALARSYDPAYVATSGVSAPATNLTEARKWYERAAELGKSGRQVPAH